MIVKREHIGIFGKMNAGKSSIMNLLTQQETSIVDPTPGTTADVKIALMEIHGLGPVKLFDTAGLDELLELGEKKKKKTLSVLKECDLVLLIINPSNSSFNAENEFLHEARELDKQILVLFNLFNSADMDLISTVKGKIPLLCFYHDLALQAIRHQERQSLRGFILEFYEPKHSTVKLLPFLKRDEFYILNIPMDAETPPGRFLRPQEMCEEYITRNWAYPVSFRMDLHKARKNNPGEQKRFIKFLKSFPKPPHALITDSQAMDVICKWVPESIMITTFSIMMIHFMSKGKLSEFVQGINKIKHLHPDSSVLIVEACNHSRIKEDIGTVQIPDYLRKCFPGIHIEHNFGREFLENKQLSSFDLIIHCGGCMISHQKLGARLRDLRAVGVSYTNYGLILSYMQGKKALKRVLSPWNLNSAYDNGELNYEFSQKNSKKIV